MPDTVEQLEQIKINLKEHWKDISDKLAKFEKNFHEKQGNRVVSAHNSRGDVSDVLTTNTIDKWIDIVHNVTSPRQLIRGLLDDYIAITISLNSMYRNLGLNGDVTMLSILQSWNLNKVNITNEINASMQRINQYQEMAGHILGAVKEDKGKRVLPSNLEATLVEGSGRLAQAAGNMAMVNLIDQQLDLQNHDVLVVANQQLDNAINEITTLLNQIEHRYKAMRGLLTKLVVDFRNAFDKWEHLYGMHSELIDQDELVLLKQDKDVIIEHIEHLLDDLRDRVHVGLYQKLQTQVRLWVEDEAPLLQYLNSLPRSYDHYDFNATKVLGLVNFQSLDEAYQVQKLFSSCFWAMVKNIHHRECPDDSFASNILTQWPDESAKLNILRFSYDAASIYQQVLQHKDNKYRQYLDTQEGKDMVFAKWMQMLGEKYSEQTTGISGDSFKSNHEIFGNVVDVNGIPQSIRTKNKWSGSAEYDEVTQNRLLNYLEIMCEKTYIQINGKASNGLVSLIINDIRAEMQANKYTNPFKAFRELYYEKTSTNKSNKDAIYKKIQTLRKDCVLPEPTCANIKREPQQPFVAADQVINDVSSQESTESSFNIDDYI
ncbi:hypothetical protein L3V82_10220 [Thiotrichales bacterium 19S3-7]|nr:hypothetical protein [Thiotrichales bacterium 19S3-7]MCF6802531.1 hypothetical protein [Thiotrichales bacterium 19S3-11]